MKKYITILIIGILFSNNNEYKIGLTLSGGGVKGLAHLGTLKMLDSLNIPIDYISGTSIGSITAALYASGHSYEEIRKICYTTKWNQIFTENRDRNHLYFFQKLDDDNFQLSFVLNKGKPVAPLALSSGQYSFEYLSELFNNYNNIKDYNELYIPFRCNATDILTGKEIIFSKGSIPKSLRASTSIPTVFSPVEYNNSLIVDGGVINNIPTNLVHDMGANFIITSDVSSGTINNKKDIQDIFDVIQKSIGLYGSTNKEKHWAQSNILIKSNIKDVNSINFHHLLMKEIEIIGNKEAYNNINSFIELKKNIKTKSKLINLAAMKDTFKIESYSFNSSIDTNNLLNKFFNPFIEDTITTKDLFINKILTLRKLNKFYNLSYKFELQDNGKYKIFFNGEKNKPTIISDILVEGNQTINTSEIIKMISFSKNDTIDAKILLNDIRKIYTLDYFHHVYYRIEKTDINNTLIIEVKEKPFQRLKIGATWDNFYKIIGKAKIDLIFKDAQIRLQNELLFSGLMQNTFNMYYTMTDENLLSIIPNIKLTNKIQSIGIIDNNDFTKHIIEHKLKSIGLGIIAPLKNRGFLSLHYNVAKSWYNDDYNITDNFTKNDLVYTNFKINIDQIDKLLKPKNGYQINFNFQSSINNNSFKESDLKYSYINFKLNYYKTFKEDHTLRYYTWYIKSIGEVPIYLKANYGGAEWTVGYDEFDLFVYNLKLYGFEYQYHYKNSTTFRFIISKPSFIDFNINNQSIQELPITYGIGVTIQSILGPFSFIWARGDKNIFDDSNKKKNIFYFNFGVKY